MANPPQQPRKIHPDLSITPLGLPLDDQLETGARRADRALGRVTKSGTATTKTIRKLQRAVTALAAATSIRELVRYADQQRLIEVRIQLSQLITEREKDADRT